MAETQTVHSGDGPLDPPDLALYYAEQMDRHDLGHMEIVTGKPGSNDRFNIDITRGSPDPMSITIKIRKEDGEHPGRYGEVLYQGPALWLKPSDDLRAIGAAKLLKDRAAGILEPVG